MVGFEMKENLPKIPIFIFVLKLVKVKKKNSIHYHIPSRKCVFIAFKVSIESNILQRISNAFFTAYVYI